MKNRFKLFALIGVSIITFSFQQSTFAEKNSCNIKNVKTVYLDENTFYYEIPDGFNLANASNEELKAYGLPEHPVDPAELEKWKKEVAGAKWVRPAIGEMPDGISFGNGPKLVNNKDIYN